MNVTSGRLHVGNLPLAYYIFYCAVNVISSIDFFPS